MDRNNAALVLIGVISFLLLLCFVRKNKLREAFFALMLAQLFSWPTMLLFVQFGWQQSPARLFPHATAGNFIFAFLFHPTIFVVYYLHYPKGTGKHLRVLYTVVFSLVSPLSLFVASLTTDLVVYPHRWVLLISFMIVAVINVLARNYMDWFFMQVRKRGRDLS